MVACKYIIQGGIYKGSRCTKAEWKDGYCGPHNPAKIARDKQARAERNKNLNQIPVSQISTSTPVESAGVPKQSVCDYIFRKGSRKGTVCKRPVTSGHRCGEHEAERLEKRDKAAHDRYAAKKTPQTTLQSPPQDGQTHMAPSVESLPKPNVCTFVYTRAVPLLGIKKGDRCKRVPFSGDRCSDHKYTEARKESVVAKKKSIVGGEEKKKVTIINKDTLFKKMDDYKVKHGTPPYNIPYSPDTLKRYYNDLKRFSKDCFGITQTDDNIQLAMLRDTTKVEKFLRETTIYEPIARKGISIALFKFLQVIDAPEELVDKYNTIMNFFIQRLQVEKSKSEIKSPDVSAIQKRADRQYEIYKKNPNLARLVEAAIGYAYTESPTLRSGDTTRIVFGINNTSAEYPNYITDDLSEFVLNEHKTTSKTRDPKNKSQFLKEVRRVKIHPKLCETLRLIKETGSIYAFPRRDLSGGLTTSMVSKITKKVLGITPNDTRKATDVKSTNTNITIEEFNALAKESGHSPQMRMSWYEGQVVPGQATSNAKPKPIKKI